MNMVQVENSESEIEEERLEEHDDDKWVEISEQEIEEWVNNTEDVCEVTRYTMEPVIGAVGKGSKMRFDKKLIESGGDLFNDLLHGNVCQFMNVVIFETFSVAIVIDNYNIGNSNKEINISSEAEWELVEDASIEESMGIYYVQHNKTIEDICKYEEIKETDSCLSDSSMVEEDINDTKSAS